MNAATAPTLPPGSDFAGYHVERRIGAGGAGETYLVRNPGLDRVECLKLLNRASGPVAIAEARTVARLGHPGTVTVFNNGAAGGHVWYTMPFAPGGDLGRYLDLLPDDGSRLREAMPMLGDIAQTIDDLHQRPTPVMHGDIKPSNILVDTSTPHRPRALLSDFGSSLAGGAGVGGPGPAGSFGATPPYLSPGRRFGRPPSAPDDRYAFACTAFEALTGHRPFGVDLPGDATARTRIEAWRQAHLAPRRPVPSDHDPALAALDPVFRRALAIEEAERHPTAGEFHRDLQAALYADPGAGGRRSRTRAVAVIGTATALVLALAGAGWWALAPRGIPLGDGCPDPAVITEDHEFELLGEETRIDDDVALPPPSALPADCRYSFLPRNRQTRSLLLVFNSPDAETEEARQRLLSRLPRDRPDPEHPFTTNRGEVQRTGRWAGTMPKGTPPVDLTLYLDNQPSNEADRWSSCVATTYNEELSIIEIRIGEGGSATGIGGLETGQEMMCGGALQLLRIWQSAG